MLVQVQHDHVRRLDRAAAGHDVDHAERILGRSDDAEDEHEQGGWHQER